MITWFGAQFSDYLNRQYTTEHTLQTIPRWQKERYN